MVEENFVFFFSYFGRRVSRREQEVQVSQAQVVTLMSDAINTVLTAALPVLLVGLIVGVVISIFQAATQINEQTLAFIPKIVGIFIALLVFGGLILTSLSEFGMRVFGYIEQFVLAG